MSASPKVSAKQHPTTHMRSSQPAVINPLVPARILPEPARAAAPEVPRHAEVANFLQAYADHEPHLDTTLR
jgi:hypothetical protein